MSLQYVDFDFSSHKHSVERADLINIAACVYVFWWKQKPPLIIGKMYYNGSNIKKFYDCYDVSISNETASRMVSLHWLFPLNINYQITLKDLCCNRSPLMIECSAPRSNETAQLKCNKRYEHAAKGEINKSVVCCNRTNQPTKHMHAITQRVRHENTCIGSECVVQRLRCI